MSPGPKALSSPWTPLHKLVPALLWLCLLANALQGIMAHAGDRGARLLFLLLLTPLLAVWFWRYFRLMDRVELVGRQLFLRRRGVEQRIELVDVLNVVPATVSVPTIVRVRLRNPGPFGDEVRFSSRLDSVSTWSLRLTAVEALVAAIDEAKLGARA
jgi:hypothetical protein